MARCRTADLLYEATAWAPHCALWFVLLDVRPARCMVRETDAAGSFGASLAEHAHRHVFVFWSHVRRLVCLPRILYTLCFETFGQILVNVCSLRLNARSPCRRSWLAAALHSCGGQQLGLCRDVRGVFDVERADAAGLWPIDRVHAMRLTRSSLRFFLFSLSSPVTPPLLFLSVSAPFGRLLPLSPLLYPDCSSSPVGSLLSAGCDTPYHRAHAPQPDFNSWAVYSHIYLPQLLGFGVGLNILLLLHCYWFCLVLKMIYRQLLGKSISEQGDVRSDSDSDSDEEPVAAHED